MPNFPPAATFVDSRIFTVQFKAGGGDPASVQIDDLPAAVDAAGILTLRGAITRLSNAGAWQTTDTNQRTIAINDVVVYDEMYSEAQTKLVLVWQDATLALKKIAIPAPDASFFGTDGVAIITPDGGTPSVPPTPAQILFDSITDITTALNAGGGTWAFMQGYRSKRAGKLRRPRPIVTPTEPGAADVPPPAPA